MSDLITEELKEKILADTYETDGDKFIRIPHHSLDFCMHYKIIGFTKKTVRLAYLSGEEWVNCQGKVEKETDCYILYTKNWDYIGRI